MTQTATITLTALVAGITGLITGATGIVTTEITEHAHDKTSYQIATLGDITDPPHGTGLYRVRINDGKTWYARPSKTKVEGLRFKSLQSRNRLKSEPHYRLTCVTTKSGRYR